MFPRYRAQGLGPEWRWGAEIVGKRRVVHSRAVPHMLVSSWFIIRWKSKS